MTKERKNFYSKLDRYLKKICKENDISILSEQCFNEQHIVMGMFAFNKVNNNRNVKKLKEISEEIKEEFHFIKFSRIKDRSYYDSYRGAEYGCTLEVHIPLPY